MVVLGYSQFGEVGEKAYLSYLRVTALSLLRDGLSSEGRALVAAADRVVGCDLGRSLAIEMAYVQGVGSASGVGESRMEVESGGRVCCQVQSCVERREGDGVRGSESSELVDDGVKRDVVGDNCVGECLEKWFETDRVSGQVGVGLGATQLKQESGASLEARVSARSSDKKHNSPEVKKGPNWERNQEWKRNNKEKKKGNKVGCVRMGVNILGFLNLLLLPLFLVVCQIMLLLKSYLRC